MGGRPSGGLVDVGSSNGDLYALRAAGGLPGPPSVEPDRRTPASAPRPSRRSP
ncbi:hypothetical protein [Nonomuraea sp. WAC 01424]|uniref:hypothetical protein n=1 Tax=Nonomuraea sp. WAC 01424 TaxID=2203200 RepID=UPI00163C11F8|nr:hypothetical protein [Nonomuraea sp. WAC 01424]